MFIKTKIDIILEVREINTLENTKKRAEEIIENMLKTRKSVAMYSVAEKHLYANFYTANNETNEIK